MQCAVAGITCRSLRSFAGLQLYIARPAIRNSMPRPSATSRQCSAQAAESGCKPWSTCMAMTGTSEIESPFCFSNANDVQPERQNPDHHLNATTSARGLTRDLPDQFHASVPRESRGGSSRFFKLTKARKALLAILEQLLRRHLSQLIQATEKCIANDFSHRLSDCDERHPAVPARLHRPVRNHSNCLP